MRFECGECRKLFEGKRMVLWFLGGSLQVFCEKCYKKMKAEEEVDSPFGI